MWEGEPGIGKPTRVTEALAAVPEPAWEVGWGGADQLTARRASGSAPLTRC